MTLEIMIKKLDITIINKNKEIQDLRKQYINNFDTLYHNAKYLIPEEIDKLLENDTKIKKDIDSYKKELEDIIQIKDWLIELQQRRQNSNKEYITILQ